MSTASTATTVTAAGELSKSVAYLNRILEHKSLVTVYTPHDYSEPIDINYVILEALAEGTKVNPVSQLQLALDWNRSDIGAKHIFNILNSDRREDVKLERMMFTALMQNQVDFVKLFIDSGFDLTKFLTVNRLDQLYEASFRTKLRKPRPDIYSLTNVGKAINFLLEVEAGSMYDESSCVKFDCPERELMYWALVFNRQELAIFMWSHCPDPLGSEFEELAVGVLDECHSSNTQLSHRLLVRQLHMWSDKTPLMIARGAYQMSFMKHACVQTKLNRLWMGNMSVNTSVWKVIFLLLPFIKFSSSELG
ncbi:Transient receptor potential cation channel trpm [Lamellibrachia satsuma]|nr:Transient receptor potential cation channel trpm [Lamellibrachia satsuma]